MNFPFDATEMVMFVLIAALLITVGSISILIGRYYRQNRHFKAPMQDDSGNELLDRLFLYQFMLDSVPFPVWKRDHDMNIIYCNQAYADCLDISPYHVVRENEELSEGVANMAKEVVSKQQTKVVRKHIIVHEDRRLYSIHEVPTEYGTLGYAQDITSQEQLEKEYKEHMQSQSELLESSKSAVAIFDRNQTLKFYNKAYVNLWKFDSNWLDEKPDYRAILDALREKRKLPEQADFQEFKRRSLEVFTNLIHTHEEYYYLPDDTVLRVVIIPHESGGLLFTYEDMTDQINLERSYNTLISVKKSTIDHLNEGICVFGADGRLQLYNPMFCEILKFEEHLLDAEPRLLELLQFVYDASSYSEEQWGQTVNKLLAHMETRKEYKQEIAYADNKRLVMSYVPLPDGAALMIFTDITDAYLAEQSLLSEKRALHEADAIKTKFLASISYELRSPLTAIKGFAEALLEEWFGKLNDKQSEYMGNIIQSSNHLTILIDNILDVASIDAGYMTLDTEQFDIRECLEQVLKDATPTSGEHRPKMQLSCPNNLGKLFADRRRIQQVVLQLLRNSIEMTPNDGEVELFAKRPKAGFITIGVRDTGVGVSEEDKERIFEKFYTSSQGGSMGTGLGLTIAKSFVELHGGTISVESELGEGTTISFTLKRQNKDI